MVTLSGAGHGQHRICPYSEVRISPVSPPILDLLLLYQSRFNIARLVEPN